MKKIVPFLLSFLISCGPFSFFPNREENNNSGRKTEIPAHPDTSYSIEIPAPSSLESVSKIQRVLSNGCDEWNLNNDGLWGPKSREAFQRCWNKCGTPPIEDVETFIDELWQRKLALILLHQFGYLKGKYELYDRTQIEDALNKLSKDFEIHSKVSEMVIDDLCERGKLYNDGYFVYIFLKAEKN